MEPARQLACLSDDFDRFRAISAKDLTAEVPSCPGWSMADLVRHVATVYLHTAEAMRAGRAPEPWPPPVVGAADPQALLDDGWAALTAEFAGRPAAAPAYTWYEPDQSVGFWVRRMAQETMVHRIDAELAFGGGVEPVPADLALDGVDEVLIAFLAYGSRLWRDEFGADLATADGRPVLVAAGGSGWLVTPTPSAVLVEGGVGPGPVAAAATVRAEPEALLRWLWGRGGAGVTTAGDGGQVGRLRRLLVTATR